jgi:hypothetical protein
MLTITIPLDPKGGGHQSRVALHQLERMLGMCSALDANSMHVRACFPQYSLESASVRAGLQWAADAMVHPCIVDAADDMFRVARFYGTAAR